MKDELSNKLIVKVKIDGERDVDNKPVRLVFEGLENTEVDLTNSSVDDVKMLFDKIFDHMVSRKQLVEFELDDERKDLFHDVSKDIIDQLNSEIIESKENIEKIWELSFEASANSQEEVTEEVQVQ